MGGCTPEGGTGNFPICSRVVAYLCYARFRVKSRVGTFSETRGGSLSGQNPSLSLWFVSEAT